MEHWNAMKLKGGRLCEWQGVGRPLRRAPRNLAKDRCGVEGLGRGGALGDRALPIIWRCALEGGKRPRTEWGKLGWVREGKGR
jgi:hypothetical protein